MSDSSLHADHGGAFFEAIGARFDHLGRRRSVINADVLDAWYDPAPRVVRALSEHLPWLIKTSPPTHAEGLVEEVCARRGLDPDHVLLGAGSSSLMYLALPNLVSDGAKVLLPDPMYGEYGHLFGKVLDVRLDRLPLSEAAAFSLDVDEVARRARDASLVVLVNPNSPTGTFVSPSEIRRLLTMLEPHTRLWVDETYVDFVGPGESAEPLVSIHPNLLVVKSLSKFYALSGMRAAYLVADPELLLSLRALTPPWSVGLLAQVAAVMALSDPGYYEARRQETVLLRQELAQELDALGLTPFPSVTNFLLVRLPEPRAQSLTHLLAASDVYIRNCDSISELFAGQFVRIAVKEGEVMRRLVEAVGNAWEELRAE
ncbi:MAG TPA: histidinol-phosphate transaminase [Fimbriimonadaceae bacterium]|nr:histidinol-phosphate transaminase [Fimbriimonadaceae bacterium]